MLFNQPKRPLGQPETPSFPATDWTETGPGSGHAFKNIFRSGTKISVRSGPGRSILSWGIIYFSKNFGDKVELNG